MSGLKLRALSAAAGAGLAVLALLCYQSYHRLLEENGRLKAQSQVLGSLAAENQRLSNALAQVRAAQTSANQQFQELISLRAEINRRRQSSVQPGATAVDPIVASTNELVELRAELARLKLENEGLAQERDELQAAASAAEETPAATPAADPERALVLRVIRTQVDTFPDKLKQSVAANDDESFAAVFSRFLQTHGIQTNGMAAAVFDARTGSIIVRATPEALEEIDRVTSALDQAP